MKFPALKRKSALWPLKSVCRSCANKPYSRAIFMGGAMRVTDAKTKSAEIAEDFIGFLDILWHSAHGGGTGADRGINVTVPLADETPIGQFEFYFCSTRCLREFFAACADELERKIKNARTQGVQTGLKRKQQAARRISERTKRGHGA